MISGFQTPVNFGLNKENSLTGLFLLASSRGEEGIFRAVFRIGV